MIVAGWVLIVGRLPGYSCKFSETYPRNRFPGPVARHATTTASTITNQHLAVFHMQLLILNGPNLNLLGRREPGIYGTRSFDDYLPELRATFPEVTIEYFQSNHEGELLDKLHEVGYTYHGIVLNAGGYTHTSVALADAVAAINTPVIEVHLSNLHAREEFRQRSLLGKHCVGSISGFKLESYRLAVQYFESLRPRRVGFKV